MARPSGAEVLCEALRAHGTQVVFGVPGTQNVALFHALKRTRLRTVVATHEAAAGFMANGYARASGATAVLTTIAGPGFTYAITPLTEAHHDSAPMVCLTVAMHRTGHHFALQEIDQAAMARPVVKDTLRIEHVDDVVPVLDRAFRVAADGEPGPVLVEVVHSVLDAEVPSLPEALTGDNNVNKSSDSQPVREVAALLRPGVRALVLAGQGAQGASQSLVALAEGLGAPVLTTCSGRGAMPEQHPLCLAVDFTFGVPAALRELHDLADVVLVLGAKLTHNGSAGFALPLDPRKLVHVDRSAAVLGANYPPRLGVVADLREFLPALVRECAAARGDLRAAGGWDEGLVARLRGVLDDARDERIANEPTLAGSGTWRAFFAQLGAAAPGELVVVTDTGLHQTLVRTHHRVKCPRGLISPSDFQSMGFGVPAAIGAALARPGASIVACVGDGAFLASGMDLLTAVREGVDLTVLVFHDGHYGVIRRQQLAAFGSASGVSLRTPDFEGLARSFGCGYVRPGSDRAKVFATLLRRPGVTLVELPMDDAAGLRVSAAKSLVREQVRRRLPRSVVSALKRLARRGG